MSLNLKPLTSHTVEPKLRRAALRCHANAWLRHAVLACAGRSIGKIKQEAHALFYTKTTSSVSSNLAPRLIHVVRPGPQRKAMHFPTACEAAPARRQRNVLKRARPDIYKAEQQTYTCKCTQDAAGKNVADINTNRTPQIGYLFARMLCNAALHHCVTLTAWRLKYTRKHDAATARRNAIAPRRGVNPGAHHCRCGAARERCNAALLRRIATVRTESKLPTRAV